MYIVQENQAPCIDINNTNTNNEVQRLLERIRYVARSCKEIRDKYQMYEGKSGIPLFRHFLTSESVMTVQGVYIYKQTACTT